jgi:hypothetical protein
MKNYHEDNDLPTRLKTNPVAALNYENNSTSASFDETRSHWKNPNKTKRAKPKSKNIDRSTPSFVSEYED